MFAELLFFEEGDLDIIPFVEQLQARLNELNISIDITPIISEEQDAKDKLLRSIGDIAKGEDFYNSFGQQVDALIFLLFYMQKRSPFHYPPGKNFFCVCKKYTLNLF